MSRDQTARPTSPLLTKTMTFCGSTVEKVFDEFVQVRNSSMLVVQACNRVNSKLYLGITLLIYVSEIADAAPGTSHAEKTKHFGRHELQYKSTVVCYWWRKKKRSGKQKQEGEIV